MHALYSFEADVDSRGGPRDERQRVRVSPFGSEAGDGVGQIGDDRGAVDEADGRRRLQVVILQ
jgi:hypothetical protein